MADTPDYTRQPPPRHVEGAISSHDLVCADLRARFHYGDAGADRALFITIEQMQERKAYGLKKYGEVLHAGNGRDHFRDALDEAQDLVVYLKTAMTKMIDDGQLVPNSLRAFYQNALDGLVELHYLYNHRPEDSARADLV